MPFTDTPQQARTLRHSSTARKVRARFPEGQRVVADVSGERGTVLRHVPGLDAQGGSITVRWDRLWNDQPVVGRHTASSLRPVDDE